MQSDWLRTFWPISQVQKISNMGFVLSTLNNTNFHYRTNSAKINDHIFQQIQKTLFLARFWSIFLIFGAKNFTENSALSCNAQLQMGFLHHAKNLKKMPGQTEERKDGKTLFNRNLPATAGGPISRLENPNFILRNGSS